MEIVLKVILFVLSVFEVYMCYRFLFLCWADKMELNNVRKVVLAVFTIVVGVGMGINRVIVLFSHWMFLTQIIVVCLSLWFVPKSRKIIAVEVTVTYFAIVALIDFLFVFIEMGIWKNRFMGEVFYAISFHKILLFAVTRILIYVIWVKMKDREGELKETVYEYRRGLFVFCVSAIIILRIYQIIFAEYSEVGMTIEIMGTLLSLIVILILAFFAFGLLIKNMEVTKNLEFISLKGDMLNEHYQQLAELVEESREHVHDMKHHLQILDNYAETGENIKIHEYLKEIGLPVLSVEKMAWTDNQMLNLILNQKKAETEKKNIAMDILIDKNCQFPLTDYEICSLFSNLLDNSLEACQQIETGERQIELQIGRKGEVTFVRLVNSSGNSPVIRDGKLQSSKREKGLHGLGLNSVKRTVERHEGDLECVVKKDRFEVYITFFWQESEKDDISTKQKFVQDSGCSESGDI